MFSDALFGHEKRVFTRADSTHMGLIEQVSGGTLFLDEIGNHFKVCIVQANSHAPRPQRSARCRILDYQADIG